MEEVIGEFAIIELLLFLFRVFFLFSSFIRALGVGLRVWGVGLWRAAGLVRLVLFRQGPGQPPPPEFQPVLIAPIVNHAVRPLLEPLAVRLAVEESALVDEPVRARQLTLSVHHAVSEPPHVAHQRPVQHPAHSVRLRHNTRSAQKVNKNKNKKGGEKQSFVFVAASPLAPPARV